MAKAPDPLFLDRDPLIKAMFVRAAKGSPDDLMRIAKGCVSLLADPDCNPLEMVTKADLLARMAMAHGRIEDQLDYIPIAMAKATVWGGLGKPDAMIAAQAECVAILLQLGGNNEAERLLERMRDYADEAAFEKGRALKAAIDDGATALPTIQ